MPTPSHRSKSPSTFQGFLSLSFVSGAMGTRFQPFRDLPGSKSIQPRGSRCRALFVGSCVAAVLAPRATSRRESSFVRMMTLLACFSPLASAKLADQGGVGADLVAELLIHADDHRIRWLDVLHGRLEARAHLGGRADAPTRSQHLVRQAWLLRGLDHTEHAPWVLGQVDLAQRQRVTQDLLVLLARSGEIIQ